MNTLNQLKQTLLQNSTTLIHAAKSKVSNDSAIYATIYQAVLKTRRIYKNLINKEHAADICISLMKRPRKRVKQSFSSVEDCIEKAMEVKIVPWKAIVSAVAVVLAAAILLPLCLTENSKPATVGGFEMENTISIGNSHSDNETYLKNCHKVEDFGGPDLTELTGTDMTQRLNGQMHYDIITTSDDVTYFVVSYMLAEEKRAEFALYRAEKDGWTELGNAPIGFFTLTTSGSGSPSSHHNVGECFLLADENDNVYVVSVYDEGVQIHRYSAKDGFSLLGQQKVGDKRQIFSDDGFLIKNCWYLAIYSCIDPDTQEIAVAISSEAPFLENDENSSGQPVCLLTYDTNNQAFSENSYFKDLSIEYLRGIVADRSGGYYLFASEDLSTPNKYGWNNSGIVLYHAKNGELTRKMLIHDETITCPFVRLLEVDEGGILHVVYQQSDPEKMIYTQIENDIVIKTFTITPTDKEKAQHTYLSFYRKADIIYFSEFLYSEYITFAKCVNGRTTKLADFKLPEQFNPCLEFYNGGATLVSQDCIVNLALTPAPLTEMESSVQELYFVQMICDYAEN